MTHLQIQDSIFHIIAQQHGASSVPFVQESTALSTTGSTGRVTYSAVPRHAVSITVFTFTCHAPVASTGYVCLPIF